MSQFMRMSPDGKFARARNYGTGTAAAGQELRSAGPDEFCHWEDPRASSLARTYQYNSYDVVAIAFAADWQDVTNAAIAIGAIEASPVANVLMMTCTLETAGVSAGNYLALALRLQYRENGGSWQTIAGSTTGEIIVPIYNVKPSQVTTHVQLVATPGLTALDLKAQVLSGWSGGDSINIDHVSWNVMRSTTS
jgi:hypothetical protein